MAVLMRLLEGVVLRLEVAYGLLLVCVAIVLVLSPSDIVWMRTVFVYGLLCLCLPYLLVSLNDIGLSSHCIILRNVNESLLYSWIVIFPSL